MQILALAAVAGGAGLSAYNTLEEGKEQAKLGKIQQQQLNAEAKATEQAGQYESRQKRKEGQRLKATQIAQMSAQGGTMTGTSMGLVADSAKEIEADALIISRNYGLEATRLRNRGALAAYEGRVARRASRIRATADTASTIGQMYLMGGVSGGKGGSAAKTKAPYNMNFL